MASNPLLKFKVEILNTVIYPKLISILRGHEGDVSVNNLWKKFREEHDCTVSFREFKEWCDDLALSPQQVTTWNLPAPTPPPLERMDEAAFAGRGGLQSIPPNFTPFTPTEEDIDEVIFDNETDID